MTPLDVTSYIQLYEYNLLLPVGGPYPKGNRMTVNSAVTALAGFMVLLSVALTMYVHPYWVALTIFVGANLLQSAFTGFCPAAMIFRAMGLKSA